MLFKREHLLRGLLLSLAVLGPWTSAWPQTPRFAYVANARSNDVSAFTIDAITGALTPVPGSPFAAGLWPVSVTVDPSGQFVYVSNVSSDNVSAFTIDATTGALTPVPGSPFAAGLNPVSVTVDPSGQFVYVANFVSDNVSAFTTDATTGALTPIPGSPFPSGPREVCSSTVDPSGRFLYMAACDWGFPVLGHAIDGVTGALTPIPGSPWRDDCGFICRPTSVTVDPFSRFVYVTIEDWDIFRSGVWAFTIDAETGALTRIPGSPFNLGLLLEPGSVTVDPSGQFVYVAAGDVSAAVIDAATGSLTPVPGSPFPAGSMTRSVTVDRSGQFVYVANEGSNNVSAFTIDAVTGALTPILGSPFPAGSMPRSVTTTAAPGSRGSSTADRYRSRAAAAPPLTRRECGHASSSPRLFALR